jgi:hypothetical protein
MIYKAFLLSGIRTFAMRLGAKACTVRHQYEKPDHQIDIPYEP